MESRRNGDGQSTRAGVKLTFVDIQGSKEIRYERVLELSPDDVRSVLNQPTSAKTSELIKVPVAPRSGFVSLVKRFLRITPSRGRAGASNSRDTKIRAGLKALAARERQRRLNLDREEDVPTHGIKVSWICDFLRNNPAVAKLRGRRWNEGEKQLPVTTHQLQSVIIALTQDWTCSLAELLEVIHPSAVKKVANRFLSHAWSHPLDKTLSLLESGAIHPDEYVFFDCLCVQQHYPPGGGYMRLFSASVQTIGQVSAVLYPISKPAVFERSWCIFELYTSSQKTVSGETPKFDILVMPEELAAFSESLLKRPGEIQSSFTRISVKLAKAQKDHDKANIEAEILRNSTFEIVEDSVMMRLSDQVTTIALQVAQKSRLSGEDPQIVYQHLVQVKTMLSELGRLGEVVTVLIDMLDLLPRAYPVESKARAQTKLKAVSDLAQVSFELGLDVEAEKWTLESLKIKQDPTYSKEIPEINQAADYSLLCEIYTLREEYEKAKEYSGKAGDLRSDFYAKDSGSNHVHPMMRAHSVNASVLDARKGDLKTAHDVMENSLAEFARYATSFTDDDVISKLDDLTPLLDYLQGNAAEIAISQDYAKSKLTMSYYPLVTIVGNLGAIKRLQGNFAESEKMLRRVLQVKKEMMQLGIGTVRTVSALNDLANVLGDQGKVAEAESVYDEALRLLREMGNESSTLSAIVYWNQSVNFERMKRVNESESAFAKAASMNSTFGKSGRAHVPQDMFDSVHVPASAGALMHMSSQEQLELFASATLFPFGEAGDTPFLGALNAESAYVLGMLIEGSVRRTFGAGFVPFFSRDKALDVLLPSIRAGIAKAWPEYLLQLNFNNVPHITEKKACLTMLDLYNIIFKVPEEFCHLDFFPEEYLLIPKRGVEDKGWFAAGATAVAAGAHYAYIGRAIVVNGRKVGGAAAYMKNLADVGRGMGVKVRPVAAGLQVGSVLVSAALLAVLNQTAFKEREGENARARHAKREGKFAALMASIAIGVMTSITIASGGAAPAAFIGGIKIGAVGLNVASAAFSGLVGIGVKESLSPEKRPHRTEVTWDSAKQMAYQVEDMSNPERFERLLVEDFVTMKNKLATSSS